MVRESFGEREILLRAAPHVIWPMRIVLPVLVGMRPAWIIRIGLFIYDHLAKRAILPGTKSLNMIKAYGTRIFTILEGASCAEDLGQHYGAGLYEAEVRYLCDVEFAKTSEDILWRRSKLGLRMSAEEIAAMESRLSSALLQGGPRTFKASISADF